MERLKTKLAKLTALLTTISSDDEDDNNLNFEFPIRSLRQFDDLDTRIAVNPAEEAKLVSCIFKLLFQIQMFCFLGLLP